MADSPEAFVPGHVTGFFSSHAHDDPARAGSRGAGVAISDGVTVTVAPAEATTVTLDGDPVDVEAVSRVLDGLGATASVAAETPLPLGAGFGVSGAMALGTALAASEALDLAHTENELVGLAHRAEVAAGTGLGDVVAQARGGLPLRLEPGDPDHGAMDGLPARGRVEYRTFGGLSTESVLAGDTDDLSAAGDRALEELLAEPTTERFVALSRRFAEATGLPTTRVERVLADVAAAGGAASMAMLGETAFALGDGLSAAGYDPAICRIDNAGARLR